MEKEYDVYEILYDGIVKYVGVTENYTRRVREHLKGGKISAIPKGVNKRDVVIISAYETNSKEDAYRVEDKLIEEFDTINNGWNKNRSGYRSKNIYNI